MVTGSPRGRRPLTGGEAKRASFKTRIRPSLKDRLEEDAGRAGRSLSEEIEHRLEASIAAEDDPYFPQPLRDLARRLLASYLVLGPGEAIKAFVTAPDPRTFEPPDEAEQQRRWKEMVDALQTARWADAHVEERYQRNKQAIDALNVARKRARRSGAEGK
jgi:hypothetical protein